MEEAIRRGETVIAGDYFFRVVDLDRVEDEEDGEDS
jgi:hypothetical protein